MLTFIAKLTIQAGKEQEFEAQMRTVVPKVREEPGITPTSCTVCKTTLAA